MRHHLLYNRAQQQQQRGKHQLALLWLMMIKMVLAAAALSQCGFCAALATVGGQPVAATALLAVLQPLVHRTQAPGV